MLAKVWRDKFWPLIVSTILGFGYIFLRLCDNYIDKDGYMSIDVPINTWVETIRTPWFNKIMLFVTLAGNWQMILWTVLLGAILLAAANKRRYLIALLLSVSTGEIVVETAKLFFGRIRPPIENALIVERGLSFPSGHSYFAVVLYGLITYFWWKHFRTFWKKLMSLILGGGVILMIAMSRIYLGVHWTTDVLAGLSISGAWLGLIIAYIEFKSRYFKTEFRAFNQKAIWRSFWCFATIWLVGWIFLFSLKANQV